MVFISAPERTFCSLGVVKMGFFEPYFVLKYEMTIFMDCFYHCPCIRRCLIAWIEASDKLSITFGTFVYNSDIQYPDDGSKLDDDDEQAIEQEDAFDNVNTAMDE